MVTRRRITGLPFLLLVSTSSATSSSVIVGEEVTQQFLELNNDVDRRVRYERYYNSDEDVDNDNLITITIPMRSRASVLAERNLLHLLDEERNMDASETFAKWVRNNGHNNRHRRGTLRLGGSSSS